MFHFKNWVWCKQHREVGSHCWNIIYSLLDCKGSWDTGIGNLWFFRWWTTTTSIIPDHWAHCLGPMGVGAQHLDGHRFPILILIIRTSERSHCQLITADMEPVPLCPSCIPARCSNIWHFEQFPVPDSRGYWGLAHVTTSAMPLSHPLYHSWLVLKTIIGLFPFLTLQIKIWPMCLLCRSFMFLENCR